ncbi:hypothetical protein FHS26_005560 [Rhizobium pisi]|uniref:DUF3955 domain-containing protein n=1 Tax=Rhizobium pisi TaxID=574561 RepID=A0A3R8ZXK1_9HYPH|nr:hypothetical protein [Rhizobium pisi]RSB65901.1 hypothetical protein EFD55_26045 [Rhizobium pisi]
MINRFRSWSLFVGFTLFGPVLLSYHMVCLVQGELPGKTSMITAADEPLLFYPLILFLLGFSLMWTGLSLLALLGRIRSKTASWRRI